MQRVSRKLGGMTRPRAAPRVLLLTGEPGVGKTTVLCRVHERLAATSSTGFLTEEVRVGGKRRGFRAVPFRGGPTTTIADVDRPGEPRVGRYGVDVEAIDRLVEETLEVDDPAGLCIVDEIGKMECLSERFVDAMRRILHSERVVLATVALRAPGFPDEVRGLPDVALWQVTGANRGTLPDRILDWLRLHGLR